MSFQEKDELGRTCNIVRVRSIKESPVKAAFLMARNLSMKPMIQAAESTPMYRCAYKA